MMRGAGIAKRSRRACATTRITSISIEASMASGTARSGRCVVASATLRPGVQSIMTGRAPPSRSASSSVWPVNSIPGVVDDALVHRCGHEPGRGTVAAGGDRGADALDHVGAVLRVQSSRDDATRRRNWNHRQLAGRNRPQVGYLRVDDSDSDPHPEHLGPATQHVRVREGDEWFAARRRRGQRDVWSDSGRFSRRQRGRASGHTSSLYST